MHRLHANTATHSRVPGSSKRLVEPGNHDDFVHARYHRPHQMTQDEDDFVTSAHNQQRGRANLDTELACPVRSPAPLHHRRYPNSGDPPRRPTRRLPRCSHYMASNWIPQSTETMVTSLSRYASAPLRQSRRQHPAATNRESNIPRASRSVWLKNQERQPISSPPSRRVPVVYRER